MVRKSNSEQEEHLYLANRLHELRMEEPAQNQEVVADEIGIANITYGRYERRERPIPVDTLVKIADYYDVSLDYLMYRTDRRNYSKHVASTFTTSSESLMVAEKEK